MRIDVYHHNESGTEQAQKLDQILASLQQLKELEMATQQQFEDGFNKVDAATTKIAALIQKYIDEKNAGGMTAEQEEAALARLGQSVAALEAMGADPVDPVPVPVPDPVP